MKMAKASEADLNMAMKLANYLDSIERGQMPDDLSEDSESIEWLDPRDSKQMDGLIDGLKRLLSQGSISRVIWGMAVVCDPANKCLDPDADTIEHHPDLVKAAERRNATEIREMLRAMQSGELTVSRGIELVDIWLAGNYSDDLLPPVRHGLGEDEMPWDRIDKLTEQNNAMHTELNTAWQQIKTEQRLSFRDQVAKMERQRDELLALVMRYRNETPLGHQPYMIAELADAAIAKVKS